MSNSEYKSFKSNKILPVILSGGRGTRLWPLSRKSYPKQFYILNYEKLVDNPAKEIPKIIEFCDLEWEDACLNFHENKRVVKTASAAQVRLPIYDTSISVTNNYSKELEKLSLMLSFED